MEAVTDARLLKISERYAVLGTLQAVGTERGITRERVRQLLVKGIRRGLFTIPPKSSPALPPFSEIFSAVMKHGTVKAAAKALGIPLYYLVHVLEPHRATVVIMRTTYKREKIMRDYRSVVDALGRHPSAEDLQKSERAGRPDCWRYLGDRIRR